MFQCIVTRSKDVRLPNMLQRSMAAEAQAAKGMTSGPLEHYF